MSAIELIGDGWDWSERCYEFARLKWCTYTYTYTKVSIPMVYVPPICDNDRKRLSASQ